MGMCPLLTLSDLISWCFSYFPLLSFVEALLPAIWQFQSFPESATHRLVFFWILQGLTHSLQSFFVNVSMFYFGNLLPVRSTLLNQHLFTPYSLILNLLCDFASTSTLGRAPPLDTSDPDTLVHLIRATVHTRLRLVLNTLAVRSHWKSDDSLIALRTRYSFTR